MLFAGVAAHSMLPLEHWGSAAFGLVLGIAGHSVGWPIARGGAQKLSDALVAHLRSLGGEIIPNWPVRSLSELPASRVVSLRPNTPPSAGNSGRAFFAALPGKPPPVPLRHGSF